MKLKTDMADRAERRRYAQDESDNPDDFVEEKTLLRWVVELCDDVETAQDAYDAADKAHKMAEEHVLLLMAERDAFKAEVAQLRSKPWTALREAGYEVVVTEDSAPEVPNREPAAE